MEYAETPPPAALAGIVRCAWTLRALDARDRAGADPALPDGSPELVVNLADPFAHVDAHGRARRQPAAFLVGQITRPFAVRPTGRVDLVAVRFEAHGASVLHQPMNEITDAWRPVARLHNRALVSVRSRLHGVTRGQRVAALLDAVEHARQAAAAVDPRIASVVTRIRAGHGGEPLGQLARDADLTMRSLQRLFATHVGVSPKLFARIVRFHRVFAAVRDEPGSLARVAAACGYYDQSHLVRDFRDFAGDAPARLLAAMPEFTAFFAV